MKTIYDLNDTFKETRSKHNRRESNDKIEKDSYKRSKSMNIIQDFEMPDVCTSIQMSEDEDHIFITGVYTPRLRCFDLSNISMKFERCMDSEVVKFALTSRSFHSLALLQNNKQLELHNRRGRHHILQLPIYGRDLANSSSQKLFIVGDSPEVSIVDLNSGAIATNLTSKSKDLNTCSVNEQQHLFLAGSSEGTIECWDVRNNKKTCSAICSLKNNCEVTCMTSLDSHYSTIGTSQGQVLLLDHRWNDNPIMLRDSNRGPINKIMHRSGDIFLSSNESSIDIWCQGSGELLSQIRPNKKINDFLLVPNTGLLCIVSDCSNVLSYFMPDVGGSPKWCPSLSVLAKDAFGLN